MEAIPAAVPLEPDKRIASRGKEPSRLKTHWDYVLEEMAWLAKDFESERKMKLSQAKKMAVKVCKSGLSTESKGLRRQKEEEQRIRRLASNIAKDVKKFWTKIEKLILYKHQLELEGRKKKALDKHLDFLVGQTERYSTMLAEIWTENPTEESQLPQDMTSNGAATEKMALDNGLLSDDSPQKGRKPCEPLEPLNDSVKQVTSIALEKNEQPDKTIANPINTNGDSQEYSATMLEKDKATSRKVGKDDEDLEFSLENNDDVEDDYSTLEADEALITEDERREELLALERESSLPIEELLKMYSSRRDSDNSEDEEMDNGEDNDEDEASEEVEEEEEEEEHEEEKTSIHAEEKREEEEQEKANRKEGVKVKVEDDEISHSKECNGKDEHEENSDDRKSGIKSVRFATEGKSDKTVANKISEGLDQLEEMENDVSYNIADAAAAAQSAQPTGFTFSTTKVRTKLPFLLKHSLREYQHIGLDWLVTMYDRRLNGILADEMGLGKTIMTISLLAHLACDKGIWGPHLIVVPTSVMLNWETEFMKWCPAFKILTYFGTAKERRIKRQGWSKANSFHVCITTYRLVIQDAKAFKRKKWKYLILDEAHLIKNWKSQRWQTLLNFNSKRRILLTGTPLQNDLMELWSLMHFLMPHIFQSHQQFRDWFNNPISGMVEGQEQVNQALVDRLHNVLRPFILRRLKQDVEKQLPKKYEHVLRCRLSKRQRNLYEDFMASSDTQATLSTGNFLGLLNVLMQLRKVCNHPDLFEGRPIISSFDMPGIDLQLSSAALSALFKHDALDLLEWNLLLSQFEFEMSAWEANEVSKIATPAPLIEEIGSAGEDGWISGQSSSGSSIRDSIISEVQTALNAERKQKHQQRVAVIAWLNLMRCSKSPLYGQQFIKQVTVHHPVYDVHRILANASQSLDVSSYLADAIKLPSTRSELLMDILQNFIFAIPAARSPPPVAWCSHPTYSDFCLRREMDQAVKDEISISTTFLRPIIVRRQLFFPDRKLIQFDCGKLQELAVLLRRLKSEGHRALIFTQMTKMLDVLESFVNLHGYTYLRLDGSTKPEERQILMQRFNTNPKIFLFILSTRSGGVGVNLVGADTVIFYDSDWNPAMDQQAQDRCHRIGQTREVHIYRLISESTIEENILKKANQKRFLDNLVIQGGSYNTDFFKKLDPAELLSGLKGVKVAESAGTTGSTQGELSNADVEAALKIAEDEADYMALKKVEQEEAAENQEFSEEGYSGKLEEDDCADDCDDGKMAFEKLGPQSQDLTGSCGKTETDGAAITIECKDIAAINGDIDEEMDMMADVKQMAAAAAAAGHGNVSFDEQLRPAERYAMRFLEIWDPIIDKDAFEAQVAFEETEWELDQLERLKQAQEAEIDEENEPLVYETWDTSIADEAYRQQLEALKRQEYEHQLQLEKMEEEMLDAERDDAEICCGKLKKAKFKSLRQETFDNRKEAITGHEHDYIEDDIEWQSPEGLFATLPDRGFSQRKRRAPKYFEDEILSEIQRKKPRVESDGMYHIEGEDGIQNQGSVVMLSDLSIPTSENAVKHNDMPMFVIPSKKVPLVKLDKEKKKDLLKSGEKIPAADPWVSSEDAVFCAIVHEYGGNWLLASDTLAGLPDGGQYRGRYRHPVHCRERFRQLLLKYTSFSSSNISSDKSVSVPLRVTEDHVNQLLEVLKDIPDDEWLLQRHFIAALSSAGSLGGQSLKGLKNPVPKSGIAPHGHSFIRTPRLSSAHTINETDKVIVGLENSGSPCTDLVATALAQERSESSTTGKGEITIEDQSSVEGSKENEDNLALELEIPDESSVYLEHPEFPNKVEVVIPNLTPNYRSDKNLTKFIRRFSKAISDQRYRIACQMSAEGHCKEWAAAAGLGLGVVTGISVSNKTQGKRRVDSSKTVDQKKRRLSKGKETDKADDVFGQECLIDLNLNCDMVKEGREGNPCDTNDQDAVQKSLQSPPGSCNGSNVGKLGFPDRTADEYGDHSCSIQKEKYVLCASNEAAYFSHDILSPTIGRASMGDVRKVSFRQSESDLHTDGTDGSDDLSPTTAPTKCSEPELGKNENLDHQFVSDAQPPEWNEVKSLVEAEAVSTSLSSPDSKPLFQNPFPIPPDLQVNGDLHTT